MPGTMQSTLSQQITLPVEIPRNLMTRGSASWYSKRELAFATLTL